MQRMFLKWRYPPPPICTVRARVLERVMEELSSCMLSHLFCMYLIVSSSAVLLMMMVVGCPSGPLLQSALIALPVASSNVLCRIQAVRDLQVEASLSGRILDFSPVQVQSSLSIAHGGVAPMRATHKAHLQIISFPSASSIRTVLVHEMTFSFTQALQILHFFCAFPQQRAIVFLHRVTKTGSP